MLASIAIVPSSDHNFQELLLNMGDLPTNETKVICESFLGSDVKKAFVFKIRRPPTAAARTDLALGIVAAPF